ncbi:MAG TPA: thioredoxin domain-containing protein [Thermoanaerobaculia bacterium]|nr:thioredoxin domain-containing protein [Thermoanaerobaculia bacterium]
MSSGGEDRHGDAEIADREPNRLIDEKSPYLQQHAYNPVDWYPWGDSAFERARAEDKPIFLSIGYSTCHWCHVMERESFEDSEIAALMNDLFVNIKVDREERPDVDRMYMATVQALTGSGGWPLSVWLTPDLHPFYAGTYYPPESRYGRPGFPDLLRQLHRAWVEQRDQVVDSGSKIVDALRAQSGGLEEAASLPSRSALDRAFRQLHSSWDRRLGGFGEAPKFPRPSVFAFLLRHHASSGDRDALEMTLSSLRKMWAGGVYDHLGGGFHRYSVDAYWRVPHFEKMLYDQAQLASAFLEAYLVSGDVFFAEVSLDVLDYVARDLRSPEGGFYSAEDADSAPDPSRPEHKEEGAFYLWERAEVEALLDPPATEVVCLHYGLSEAGNTISDPQGELGTRNVLYRAASLESVAEQCGLAVDAARRIVHDAGSRLLAERNRRPRPHLDDKVIVAWNGLMLSAFARAYQVMGRPQDLEAARGAAAFVRDRLWDPDTRSLRRRFRAGEARFAAQLDDYAFLVQGLLDLYEADFDAAWLEWAEALQEELLERFADPHGGALFDNPVDPHVLVRSKELYDGAEPSGNAIAALDLVRLSWFLDRPEWRERAAEIVRAAGPFLERAPHAVPQMLVALDHLLSEPSQVVVGGALEAPETRRLLETVRSRFMPHRVVLHADGGEGQARLGRRLPFLDGIRPGPEVAVAHVCREYRCELPVSSPEALAEALDRAAG